MRPEELGRLAAPYRTQTLVCAGSPAGTGLAAQEAVTPRFPQRTRREVFALELELAEMVLAVGSSRRTVLTARHESG